MTKPACPTNTPSPSDKTTASLPGISVRLLPDGMARRLIRTQRAQTERFDAQYGGRLSPLI